MVEDEAVERIEQVEARTGLKKSAIYERVARGEFPPPIAITDKARGWLRSEVVAWIAARAALRDRAGKVRRKGRGKQPASVPA